MKLAIALLSAVTITGCAERRYIGNMSMGIPLPNCDGFERPELNPACPEYVSAKMQQAQPETTKKKPVEKPE